MKEDSTKNSIFADDGHKQETLALDFAADEKAKVYKPGSAKNVDVNAESAGAPKPSETPKPAVDETKPAAAAATPAASRPAPVNKPLFQKFESEYDDENSPAMPAYRSAVYPAGYNRHTEPVAANEKTAAAVPTLSPSTNNVTAQDVSGSSRKAPEAKRSEPEKTAVVTSGKKSSKSIKSEIAFGKLLYDARTRLNMSITQAAQITKISETYIDALEREDLNSLPPTVYVCAYLRKLSALYKVDQSQIEQVIEELKENSGVSISGEIIAHLDIDRELNPESEQKVRNLYWMVGAAALFFIGIVSVAILMLTAPADSASRKQASAATPAASPVAGVSRPAAVFDPARLEKLRIRQSVPVSELSPRH